MAGGDGSQALVASIAIEHGLPFVCVSAGTRNHFALDLGLDREDPRASMSGFTDAVERRVDYATVNGRLFVNNVSVGLYGLAVQRGTYRDAKIRTVLDTVPEVLGPEASPDVRWQAPDGSRHQGSPSIVVSNNSYRLSPPVGAGTRPRLDQAVLGVAIAGTPGGDTKLRAWVAPS